jgi:hypothetical protein
MHVFPGQVRTTRLHKGPSTGSFKLNRSATFVTTVVASEDVETVVQDLRPLICYNEVTSNPKG